MIDYRHKAAVIESGLVKKVKNLRKHLFMSSEAAENEYYFNELYNLALENPDDFKEAAKVAAADFQRNTRLKNRIRDFLQIGNCIFLTLTFRDDVLENTSEKTRRLYVTQCLKSCSKYYIANIDYGDNTQREHYHAIVVSDHVPDGFWSYGYYWRLSIIKDSNPLRLAKYISKLTNHAIKETTRRNHIIYSRVPWDERVKDKADANRSSS